MKETSKTGAKSIIMSNNNRSFDLNRSVANSIITSSYIILKDGTRKRKRHVNSYMEEFLEKRRMAAEFAQTKRSTSSKNPRIKVDKSLKDNLDENYSMNLQRIEQAISINNLKNNLPGKTTALIDNTNMENNDIILEEKDNNKEKIICPETSNKYIKYINVQNKDESLGNGKNLIINNQNINNNYYINKQNNFNYNIPNITNEIIENKYNTIKRHNIVYTKKKGQNLNNNKNISNHSFTENRYTSINNDNDEQCNIINTNELNISNNKDMDLLGPQLPEDAFLENNHKMISIQNDYITLENTNNKSLSKDIQNINNFKDISPIKSINTTQKEERFNQLNKNNENETQNANNENLYDKNINKSERFLSIMQKMINNNEYNNNLEKDKIYKSSNISNLKLNDDYNQQYLNKDINKNSNMNLYEIEDNNIINNNSNKINAKNNQNILNSNQNNELINNNKELNNNIDHKNNKITYEKFLNKNENINIGNLYKINNESTKEYSNQDNNYYNYNYNSIHR